MQDQNCLTWVFLGWDLKKLLYCGILYQHPQSFRNTKFRPKIKIRKFGTKIAVIGCFGLKFQKTNVVFEISILAFVNKQNFIQKQRKTVNLGPKIPYLGIFGQQFRKNYFQIFNQHRRICETVKFHPKQKKNILGAKNALFAFLGWNIEKLLSYL